MNTVVASLMFLGMGSASAVDVFQSQYMNQAAYAGAGSVLSMGTSQNTRAFFEQDFKKLTLEQKEFAATNMLRELVFFNIGPDVKLDSMGATEKELFVNKSVSDPIHQRIKVATEKAVKDILDTTDFNVDKNPAIVPNLKKLLVKINLLLDDDKSFEFVNEYRAARFEQAFDSNNLDEIWKSLFASKYGEKPTPEAHVMFESFDKQYPAEEIEKMFEALKGKK